jgi:hypothetical protein
VETELSIHGQPHVISSHFIHLQKNHLVKYSLGTGKARLPSLTTVAAGLYSPYCCGMHSRKMQTALKVYLFIWQNRGLNSGPLLARKVHYLLNHIPCSFFLVIIQLESCTFFLLRWSSDCDSLTSASCIAGITDMHHHACFLR